MTQPLPLVASLEGPAGAPVLVLGNSLGTTREVWEPQAPALGERFRLLRFEHRGHGGAPAPAGPHPTGRLGAGAPPPPDRLRGAGAPPRRHPAGRGVREVPA